MDMIKEKESDIQKTVLEWLSYNEIFAIRLNNIPVPTKNGGFRPVAVKGLPDAHLELRVSGVPVSVWIEFKTKKGKQSQNQIIFQKKVEDYGGFYYIVRSIEDIQKVLHKAEYTVLARIGA